MTVMKLLFTRVFFSSVWFTVHTVAVAEAAVWVGHCN